MAYQANGCSELLVLRAGGNAPGFRRSRRGASVLAAASALVLALAGQMAAASSAFTAAPETRRRQLLGLFGLLAGTAGRFSTEDGAAHAISGGGKDYSGLTLTKSFQGGDFSGKDFSGCVAQGVDFTKAKFRGDRFYKADLKNADFSGSDLTGASLEAANLEGAVLDNANMDGAYFTETIISAKSMKGATFNDALFPQKVAEQLCKREDVQASDASKESLMCP